MSGNERDGLPIPDYDHLPIGSLETHLRTLDRPGLEKVLAYERDHGDRLPVVNVLQRRIEALDAGAEPTGGSAQVPTSAAPLARESKVGPRTEGPPVNPPSHGVPTNPAQPR